MSKPSRRFQQRAPDSANVDPSRGCEGKFSYPTFTKAEQNAQRSRRSHKQKMTVYRCKHCGGYHYGNSINEPQRSRMKRTNEIIFTTGDDADES